MRLVAIFAALLLSCGVVLGATAVRAQGPAWSDEFGLPSVDGPVGAIVEADGRLFIGGAFTAAGPERVRNVVALDPASGTWDPLGGGVDGPVHAFALSTGGTLSRALYVGGAFASAGGVPARNVARYDLDTGEWTALGGGVGTGDALDIVRALAVGPDGALYAGGDFAGDGAAHGRGLARWDGAAWGTLGAVGPTSSYYVAALVADGDRVCAGGRIAGVGGVAASHVACYAPATGGWDPLGGGVQGGPFASVVAVNALALRGATLYVGGRFTEAGGGAVAARNAAAYDLDGGTWSALGNGTEIVTALAALDGDLYAGQLGGPPSLSRWDGAAWAAVDVGPIADRPVDATNVEAIAAVRGALYVGTADGFLFGEGAANPSAFLFRYDPEPGTWAVPGRSDGLQSRARALAAGPDGRLYAAGDFRFAGPTRADYVAAWDGAAWALLGGGLDGSAAALAVGGGRVYVGGAFTAAVGGGGGRVESPGVAVWDPDQAQWTSLGGGVVGPVHALLASPEGLYVAGGFDAVVQWDGAEVIVEDVARWDPAAGQWAAVPGGHGVDVPFALARDADGALYLGGVHILPDLRGVARVARLGPGAEAWTTLRDRVGPEVRALAVEGVPGAGGRLYAGVRGDGVWVWDGAAWADLGGLSRPEALLLTGGSVVAAGKDVVRWDGAAWSPLGGGIATESGALFPQAYALAAWDGGVCVGGEFRFAGFSPRVPSVNVGCYGPFGTAMAPPPGGAGVRVSVSPNPLGGRGTVRFDLGRPADVRWSLFDVRGRRVARGAPGPLPAGPSSFLLDISALPPGLYVLRLQGDRTATARVTVVR